MKLPTHFFGQQFAVLSDTVGFISELPVSLVDAFQATLEEVLFADVLLHVIDTSDENVAEQREATMKVRILSTMLLLEVFCTIWYKSKIYGSYTYSFIASCQQHCTIFVVGEWGLLSNSSTL